MRRLVVAAFFVVLASAAEAERRVALVIGADDYKSIRKLDNAAADAQTIGDMLEKLGFEVTLETDRNLKRTRRALEDFREDGEGADVALVYYAGHGVEIGGENRLLPTDADASSLDALKNSTLPLEEVRETVAGISKVGLILLDACRNDPFGATPAGDGGQAGDDRSAVALAAPDVVKKVKPGLGRIGRAEGILFAFSAAPGETAADGADGHSPFATALVKYLGTDGLEVRSALTLVQQEVYDLSRGRQLPYVESGLPSLFFAATTKDKLPERERLLLAMADVTPDLRTEVESLASDNDMPLAPLYAALIASDAKDLPADQRLKKLNEAAEAFVTTRTQIRTLGSSDPAVTKLREEAEAQLSLGAFDAARGKLAQAATIDSTSRDALKANFIDRTLSEATTHVISGGTSRADLNYDLAIASYEKASALYAEVGDGKLPQEQRQQQFAALDTLGDLYVTTGDLAKARSAFERGQALADAMNKADPDNPDWKAARAGSTLKVGDVVRDQGDSAGALAAYQDGIGVYPDLSASRDPRELGLAADAYLRIGAIQKLQGDAGQALASYEASRDIAQKLASADAGNDVWLATLGRSYRLIGEIQLEGKQLPEAAASFQSSLDIARQLAEAKPDDALRQFELASAYDGMGASQYAEAREVAKNTYVENGSEQALASYEASMAITRRLVAADPKNTAWQRALGVTLERFGEANYFGDNNITKEDADTALAAYQEASAIRERLVAADPTNKLWVGDLVSSYEKTATWYEFVPDDVTALEFTKKAHENILKLAALDPQNVDWQRNATMYHAKIAGSYVQLKDYRSALAYDQAGLDYAMQKVEANPDKQVYQSDAIVFHTRVAFDKKKLEDWDGFFKQNDLRLAAAQKFAGRFPQNTASLRDLADAYVEVADTYTKNFPDDALKLYAASLDAADKAAAIDPRDATLLSAAHTALLKSGYCLEEHGRAAEALKAYQGALDRIEKAIATDPSTAHYTYSRDHVVARLAAIRDAAGASNP